jgi:hypothetical protein
MITVEEWKPYPKDGRYQVSSIGNVRKKINTSHPERSQYLYMTPFYDKNGYKRIALAIDGKSIKISIHRLVYETFIGDIEEGFVCCHIDGVKTNNYWFNLKKATQKENIGHKRGHGTWQEGEKHPKSKLTNEQALKVIDLLKSAKRTICGKLQKKEPLRISIESGVEVRMIYNISRARSSYACLRS